MGLGREGFSVLQIHGCAVLSTNRKRYPAELIVAFSNGVLALASIAFFQFEIPSVVFRYQSTCCCSLYVLAKAASNQTIVNFTFTLHSMADG
ncbi:hypothetical protein QQP08_001222 [Theobroma cacao]|nr:hypothetical protein QQP08_001222 [Theobroma cacao]